MEEGGATQILYLGCWRAPHYVSKKTRVGGFDGHWTEDVNANRVRGRSDCYKCKTEHNVVHPNVGWLVVTPHPRSTAHERARDVLLLATTLRFVCTRKRGPERTLVQ